MNYAEKFQRLKEESKEEFIARVCQAKQECGMSWDDVRDICNGELSEHRSESYYRKNFKVGTFTNVSPNPDTTNLDSHTLADIPSILDIADMGDDELAIIDDCNDIPEQASDEEKLLMQIKMEKVKLSDERAQNNAYVRRMAREDTIKEIALAVANTISSKKVLPHYELPKLPAVPVKSAILCISDWHYGLDINNYWNQFTPEICIARVNQLKDATIEYCLKNNVKELYVVNLADLIAGRIHAQIRIQSRYDVITQIEHISEIVAEFLNDLSEHFQVHYYDCLDNHSRLEPNKNESLDLESLARITTWYLKSRLANTTIQIHDNEFGLDIISFNVKGFNVIGVHGDKDRPINVAKKLTLNTRRQYDMVLTAHRHHFSADEDNECLIVSNGTLMGTDDYATSLRLNSKPSQNLIIVSDENVAECIYRIILK